MSQREMKERPVRVFLRGKASCYRYSFVFGGKEYAAGTKTKDYDDALDIANEALEQVKRANQATPVGIATKLIANGEVDQYCELACTILTSIRSGAIKLGDEHIAFLNCKRWIQLVYGPNTVESVAIRAKYPMLFEHWTPSYPSWAKRP